MRVALVLAVLAGLLTTGCLGGGAPKAAVVTVTRETPANAAEPTPTWQQWLGEQLAKGECGDPNNILMYQNVRREPPYSADFFCWTASTPNVVATQVAAIPTPTRRPDATPRSTGQPTATLAQVSTPTPTWRQTAIPFPTPAAYRDTDPCPAPYAYTAATTGVSPDGTERDHGNGRRSM